MKCSASVTWIRKAIVSLGIGCFACDNLDIVDGDNLFVLHLKMAIGDHQRPDFVTVIVVLQVALSAMQSVVSSKDLAAPGQPHNSP